MVRFKVLGVAAALAAGLVSATAANAGPFEYGPPDREVLVERVAGGCGPGFHPNPWGHCRPNDRGYGYGGGWGGPRGYGDRGGYDRGYGGGYGRGYGEGGPRRFYGGY